MRRHPVTAPAFGLFLLVIGLAYCLFHSREPVYQGKPLSRWLIDLRPFQFLVEEDPNIAKTKAKARQDAANAIRQIGTNALPSLLRMFEARDSRLHAFFVRWAKLFSIRLTSYPERRERAISGLAILGTNASPAIPMLTRFLDDPGLAQNAIIALQRIGEKAIPALIAGVTNGNANTRAQAALTLGYFGPAARNAVGPLKTCLHDSDAEVRKIALQSLSQIIGQADETVAAAISALEDSDPEVRAAAGSLLGECKKEATSSVPALVKRISIETNPFVKTTFIFALNYIDPTAAERIGVRVEFPAFE